MRMGLIKKWNDAISISIGNISLQDTYLLSKDSKFHYSILLIFASMNKYFLDYENIISVQINSFSKWKDVKIAGYIIQAFRSFW